MNAIAQITRPLPNIVCDLNEVRGRLNKRYARSLGLTPAEQLEWDRLEERHAVLEGEFAAAFYANNGVSWSACSDAMS